MHESSMDQQQHMLLINNMLVWWWQCVPVPDCHPQSSPPTPSAPAAVGSIDASTSTGEVQTLSASASAVVEQMVVPPEGASEDGKCRMWYRSTDCPSCVFDNQWQWSIQQLDFHSEQTSSDICLHREMLGDIAVHEWCHWVDLDVFINYPSGRFW